MFIETLTICIVGMGLLIQGAITFGGGYIAITER